MTRLLIHPPRLEALSVLLALTVVRRVSQAKERRAGAADVVPAGEPQGADGAAGGADEAAQGDKLGRRPTRSILSAPFVVTSLAFPSPFSSLLLFLFFSLTLLQL